jgi:hypothetical protein
MRLYTDWMDPILPRLQRLSTGTVIPKPETQDEFMVKGWGKRNGEAALIYFIPNTRILGSRTKRASLLGNGNRRTASCSTPASSPENGSTPTSKLNSVDSGD